MRKSLVIANKFKPALLESQFRRMKIDSLVEFKIFQGADLNPDAFQGKADQLTLLWASKQQVIDVLAKNPNIKWIHSLLAGVDGIMSPELTRHPAPLTNAKGAYSESLGEWAVFCMLWHSKNLNNWFRLTNQATWAPAQVGMAKDLTLGIYGYGDIGIECARHVKGAFGSKIIAMKSNVNSVSEKGRQYADEIWGNDRLEEMLQRCDVVISCVPLTPLTKHIWNRKTFSMMKKTATFVNIGRGPNVNEADLAACLKDGTIAGAVLDVFEVEPLPASSPLWGLPNVYITPHCADLTFDFLDRSFDIFGHNMRSWLENKPLINHVNKETGY